MKSKRKKRPPQSKLDSLAVEKPPTKVAPDSQTFQAAPVSKEISEAGKKAFADLLKRTFGTEEEALQDRFLRQAASAVSDFAGREMKSFDYVAAAVRGTGPKDALPAMRNGRCRMHGGTSTGPRTLEGLARSRRAHWKHAACIPRRRRGSGGSYVICYRTAVICSGGSDCSGGCATR